MSTKNLFAIIFLTAAFCICFACVKEYSYEGNNEAELATGTLKDASGFCLPNTFHGTLFKGITACCDTVYIQQQVRVIQTGYYSISTNTINGVQFSSDGYFKDTGINTILLKANGTPLKSSSAIFNIIFNKDTCSISININNATTDTASTQPVDTTYYWSFNDSLHYYQGPLKGSYNTDALIGKMMLVGNENLSDTVLKIYLELPDTSMYKNVPADYFTKENNYFQFSENTTNNNAAIYKANAYSSQQITVRLIDYSAGVLTGWFFGTAQDKNGNSVKIKNGTFVAKIR